MTPLEFHAATLAGNPPIMPPSWWTCNWVALKSILTDKSYVYLATFTLDPKKNSSSAKLKQAVNRLKDRPYITYLEVATEKHKSGAVHYHAAIKSSQRIHGPSFKQYFVRKYGRTDLSPSKTGDIEPTLVYIRKDGNTTILKE